MSNVEAKIRRWKTADNDLIKACTKVERRGKGSMDRTSIVSERKFLTFDKFWISITEIKLL